MIVDIEVLKENITHYYSQNGLSEEDFKKRLIVTSYDSLYVTDIYNGTVILDERNLNFIAKALNISVEELLSLK